MGIIELKHRSVRHGVFEDGESASSEPPVPFKCIEEREWSLVGVTHMFLAQSPLRQTAPYWPTFVMRGTEATSWAGWYCAGKGKPLSRFRAPPPAR
jgi:hypothetical protein